MISDLDIQRASYPRVSTIIGKQNSDEYRSIPIEVLANACERGTKVHGYCNAILEGLWIPDIEPEYKPYVDAFEKWLNERKPKILSVSKRLYDDVKRFTGEFDLIVELDGAPYILDIKTSSAPSKAWPVQLAAYEMLASQDSEINKLGKEDVEENNPCFYLMNLHLKKTVDKEGNIIVKYKEIPCYLNLQLEAKEIFNNALACYDYFTRKELKP